MTKEIAGPHDDRYFDQIETACETVLAPFREWADGGFAEGALDLLPSARESRPPVISARVLNEVWEAALSGWDPDVMTDDDRAEASARFEFTHSLLNRLMTREAEIRDAYYKARRNGMAARTLVLAATVAGAAIMVIACPIWISVPATFAGGVWIGRRAKSLSRKVERARPPADAARLIVSVLPWRTDGVAKTA